MENEKDNQLYDISVDELKYIVTNIKNGFVGEKDKKQLPLQEYCYFVTLQIVDESLRYFLKQHPCFKYDKKRQNEQIKCVLNELRRKYYYKMKNPVSKNKEHKPQSTFISPEIDLSKYNAYLNCHFAYLLGFTYNDLRAQKHGEYDKIETVLDLLYADFNKTSMIPNYKEDPVTGEYTDIMFAVNEKDIFKNILDKIETAKNNIQPGE